ncbi:MAG: hypothetical protein CL917_04140 [Deltaproteobacteria bacterium]|nr:hypothetical protein [Deltaproteobacteria bacterium]
MTDDNTEENDTSANQTTELLAEGIAFHREGQLTKAEWKYAEILEIDPHHAESLHLLGVIANQLGDTKLATDRLQQSLELAPDQPRALNNLGNIHAEGGQHEDAIKCYTRAIELSPDYAQAFHNLGNVYGDRDCFVEAIASYNRAIELSSADNDSRMALGAVLERIGEFQKAIVQYQTAAQSDPDSLVPRHRLGAVFRKTGDLIRAANIYNELATLSPNDPVIQHLQAACGAAAVPEQASSGYVKATFDGLAAEFDDCLASLRYQVPEKLHAMLRETSTYQSSSGGRNVVDLGCGTGLCGSWLKDQANHLVGVDLSPEMLFQAREKDLYDDLVESELTEYLQQSDGNFDLLIAADTLIYLGNLRPLFSVAYDKLVVGGEFLFSVEKYPEEKPLLDFCLRESGRYAHSESAITRWLSEAGFQCQKVTHTDLRQEASDAVTGLLLMAKKIVQ